MYHDIIVIIQIFGISIVDLLEIVATFLIIQRLKLARSNISSLICAREITRQSQCIEALENRFFFFSSSSLLLFDERKLMNGRSLFLPYYVPIATMQSLYVRAVKLSFYIARGGIRLFEFRCFWRSCMRVRER